MADKESGVSVKVPASLLEAVKAEAKAEDRTITAVIARALRAYLRAP
jgi:hypothetical protein